jgi:diguanylate cyclase (GGDEF)-like protein
VDDIAPRPDSGPEPSPAAGRIRHRFVGRLEPHRQIWVLCAISVLVAGFIAAVALNVLVPTRRSLDESKRRLVAPVHALDVAEDSYRQTTTALPRTISPDLGVRTEALTELTALNARGDGAWSRYRRIAADLPGERALQRTFIQHRRDALKAGSLFVSAAEPAALLGDLSEASTRLTGDLDRIKDLYHARTQRELDGAAADVGSAVRILALIALPLLALLLVAFAGAARGARLRERRMKALDAMLRKDAERNELDARLQRAFEMVHHEDAAYDLVRRSLAECEPGLNAEVLVADSSRAHFRQATSTDPDGGPGCPVLTPSDCPAATWGQTQVWPSSEALDACPHLAGRPGGPWSAFCVPINIGGNASGVVHALRADVPSDEMVGKVKVIARKVGERVGMLRAFVRSETQAHTDPLTGLMNRRSLEAQIRELTDGGHLYVVAYGDLDHFKQLNDVHGHETGDRALRLFARVLRDAVRPNDLVARYGGEEFVVVLPDCTTEQAFVVIDRIRERLALALVSGPVPRFTVSFGVAGSRPHQTFSETLDSADAALLEAKTAGRDRVLVAGASGPPSLGDDVAAAPAGASDGG